MSRREKFKKRGASIGRNTVIAGSTGVGIPIGGVGSAVAYIAATEGLAAVTATAVGAFFTGPPGWIAWLALVLSVAAGAKAGYELGRLEEDNTGLGARVGSFTGDGIGAFMDFIGGDDERQLRDAQERAEQAEAEAQRSAQAEAQAQEVISLFRRDTGIAQQQTREAETEIKKLQIELEEKNRLIRKLSENKEIKIETEQKRDISLIEKTKTLEKLRVADAELIKKFSQRMEELSEEVNQKNLTIAVYKNQMHELKKLITCPITLAIMKSPVTPGDGHCYEAVALQEHCDNQAEKYGKIFMPNELYRKFRSSGKQSLEQKEEAKYICSPMTRTPLPPPEQWARSINIKNLADQYRQTKAELTVTAQSHKEEKYKDTELTMSTTETVPRKDHIVGQQFRAIGNSTASSSSLPSGQQQDSIQINNSGSVDFS